MSTLSELLPSGGGGSTVDFVASGTLPNGKPVILKTNGQVEVVGESSNSVAESIPSGSEASFKPSNTADNFVAFDPNNAGKFVVTYTDSGNSSYGTAIVGEVSGNSISFGSEVVFNSASTAQGSMAFDPNTANKFVVAYQNSSSTRGEAIVGTVSGNSITFGSVVVLDSSGGGLYSVAFDPNTAGKFAVAYTKAYANGEHGTAVVGTVSGTSISFGSFYTYNSAATYENKISFDPNTANKFVVSYVDAGGSNYGRSCIGVISGTSISFGSEYVFNGGSTDYVSCSFDPNTANKFVVSYQDNSNSGYGTAVAGSVSGTSISFGSEVVFNSASTAHSSMAFDPNTAGKFVVFYKDSTNSNYGEVRVGSLSGTTISFGSVYLVNSGSTSYTSVSFDPNTAGKFVAVYRDTSDSRGQAILGQIATTVTATNLTSTNFVGTSTAAYTNGQTATIAIQGGLSTNQTGLTIGSTYYAQGDGTISTVSTSPAINIGKALSATTLLLKDL